MISSLPQAFDIYICSEYLQFTLLQTVRSRLDISIIWKYLVLSQLAFLLPSAYKIPSAHFCVFVSPVLYHKVSIETNTNLVSWFGANPVLIQLQVSPSPLLNHGRMKWPGFCNA